MIMNIKPLLAKAKWAYSTRRVISSDATGLSTDFLRARPGDLLLARVQTIGHHARIQLHSGRPADLYEGDTIVIAVGARYAPDQFEGAAAIAAAGCDLLAAGGIAGQMRQRHDRVKDPTKLIPIGLLTDPIGEPLNLEHYGLPIRRAVTAPPMIGVLGASMNSGKTTCAADLINGMARAGFTVGAMKVTGTGAAGDGNTFHDAGAALVLDFTDAGLGTTYGATTRRLEAAMVTLAAHMNEIQPDVIVVEVADGLFQSETALLIRSETFGRFVGGVLFASPDALSMVAGTREIAEIGLPLLATGGLITRSPLAVGEAQRFVKAPLLTREQLRHADAAITLKNLAERRQPGALADFPPLPMLQTAISRPMPADETLELGQAA